MAALAYFQNALSIWDTLTQQRSLQKNKPSGSF